MYIALFVILAIIALGTLFAEKTKAGNHFVTYLGKKFFGLNI